MQDLMVGSHGLEKSVEHLLQSRFLTKLKEKHRHTLEKLVERMKRLSARKRLLLFELDEHCKNASMNGLEKEWVEKVKEALESLLTANRVPDEPVEDSDEDIDDKCDASTPEGVTDRLLNASGSKPEEKYLDSWIEWERDCRALADVIANDKSYPNSMLTFIGMILSGSLLSLIGIGVGVTVVCAILPFVPLVLAPAITTALAAVAGILLICGTTTAIVGIVELCTLKKNLDQVKEILEYCTSYRDAVASSIDNLCAFTRFDGSNPGNNEAKKQAQIKRFEEFCEQVEQTRLLVNAANHIKLPSKN